VGSGLVILGVLEGDQSWAWASIAGIGVPAAGVVLLIAFVLVERRAVEPVLPLWVFRSRLLTTTNLVAAFGGALLYGLSSYVPTFVQDVLGTGPLVAGLAIGALSLGWPISGSQSGQIYTRIGFRYCSMIGAAVAIGGCVLLTQLDRSSSVLQVSATCFLIGLGMGLCSIPPLIGAQSSVGWNERGVVTGVNQFFRAAGSAIGVAVFGAIANATIGHDVPGAHPDAVARAAVELGVHHVFIGVLVSLLLAAIALIAMPNGARRPGAAQAAASTDGDAATAPTADAAATTATANAADRGGTAVSR
jgi:MFS family permease